MLSQVVAVCIAVSAGAWVALRWMKNEVARVDGEMRRARRVLERAQNGPTVHMQFDPETGHYHPTIH